MAETHMQKINDGFKEIGEALARMSVSFSRTSTAIDAFRAAHHDQMNATVSARVLQSMGHPDLARFYE